MNAKTIKYPRTPHLPWSPGFSPDDVIGNAEWLPNANVVISEKMDGECTTLYSHENGFHARSMDGRFHPSQAWCKALHAAIRNNIPSGWRICGENLYAEHSIHYNSLHSFFLIFSIWNEFNLCLSYDDTVIWSQLLDLSMVPTLWKGNWPSNTIKEKELIQSLIPNSNTQEGYVIRNANSFHYNDFQSNIAKWVRPNHVQTDEHWKSKPIIPNNLLTS